MPELTFVCGDKEYVRTQISVETYRKYTELMEKNTAMAATAATLFNTEIIKTVFGISEREVRKADAIEQITAAKTIHFFMQEIILPKFLELNPDRPEMIQKEKSAFDEYDEENGYVDKAEEEGELWKSCRDSIDRVIKICVRGFNDSITNVMQTDIISLLDHVAFEMRTINE